MFRDPRYFRGAARAASCRSCAPTRRSRSGSPAAAPARRSTRSRSCCARRACSSARSSTPPTSTRTRSRSAEAGVYDVDRIAGVHREPPAAGGTRRCPTTTPRPTARAVFDSRCASTIVFSDHSLATDSVFAEVQLVSCRNVLIYFDRALQDRAVGLFRDVAVPPRLPRPRVARRRLRFSAHADAFTSSSRERADLSEEDAHER